MSDKQARRARSLAASLAGVTLAVATAFGLAAPATAEAGRTQPPDGGGGQAEAAVRSAGTHSGAMRSGPAEEFTVTGTPLVDPDGTTHVRLTRTYRGLPVLGGDAVVHQTEDGDWLGSSQTLSEPVTVAVTPAVSRAKAETAALAPSPVTRSIAEERVATSRLVVDATGANPRLAYEVVTGGVQEGGTPSRLATYVAADSGTVLRTEQQIQTVDGSGRSMYSGTVPLQLARPSSAYVLKDPTRGGTYTTDLRNKEDSIECIVYDRGCDNGTRFTSPDAVFGTGAAGSRETAAVDAQYGTNVTWDYFKQVHGRNGIWNDGRGSLNRVHFGQGYADAFWDGEKMSFGDGDGIEFGPLTSLDVTGHEVTHGITENSANLIYGGESGGLNEATSDIFGTAVEFFAANPKDPADYLVGERFDLDDHGGFRRMDKPSRDGESVDCWSRYVGDLDVHHSSGVGNHFFYLLSEGSGAKTLNGVSYNSPTCNGKAVSGIGQAAAAKIWYRALTVYMTNNTDYRGARTATLNAARDLYGAASVQYTRVNAAWAAVKVS